MELTYKILLQSFLVSGRGRYECSILELHPKDFSYILNEMKSNMVCVPVQMMNAYKEMEQTNLYDAAMRTRKFIFHDSIVLPNLDVPEQVIRTFNRGLFLTREFSFEELAKM
jgi:hypothetical protein